MKAVAARIVLALILVLYLKTSPLVADYPMAEIVNILGFLTLFFVSLHLIEKYLEQR